MKEANFSNRREYWRALIQEQKQSGLSQAEFCSKRGLSRSSFYNWASLIRRDGASEKNLIPVSVGEAKRSSSESMRVVFESGATLYFVNRPDPEWIAELMRKIG